RAMAGQLTQASEKALMREMGLSEPNIERRRKYVALGPDDYGQIASIKEIVLHHAEEALPSFFNYLSALEEARALFANRELAERVRFLQREHIVSMVQGDYGLPYVEQRLTLGLLYSRAGLDVRVFLGAFHHLLRSLGQAIMKRFERTPLEGY